MKNIFKNFGLIVGVASAVFASSCADDIDPVISELETDRAFAPTDLRAFVRDQTVIELRWLAKEEVTSYEVEFSEDSLEFNSIVRTVSVLPNELPLQESFEGETRYSARVKAIVEGQNESSWATVTIMTAVENIFETLAPESVAATSVTLNWPAGAAVTKIVINPGNIEKVITPAEQAAGQATIEGLTGETLYTATLFNNAKRRGIVEFETLVDIGTATPVRPEDDLLAIIEAAAEGDVLALFPGEYGSLDAGLTIDLTKSISIKGVYPFDKPIIYGQVTCGTAVSSITIQSITFIGEGFGQFYNVSDAAANVASLSIIDCDISGFSNNFIYNNSGGAFGDILVSNSYVHDIPGGGGDGFDFRGGTINSLTVENNTFSNAFRTFLRMQAECNSVFRNNTFYKVSTVDSGNNRGLFRSSGGGSIQVSNCLFVGIGIEGTTRGFWTRSGDMSANTTYSNNYYFDSPVLFADGSEYTDPSAVDATEANPNFADADNADFTVGNQDIKDNAVGDPRWLE